MHFVVASVYLDPGLGLGGANLHMFVLIYSSMRMHRFPWAIGTLRWRRRRVNVVPGDKRSFGSAGLSAQLHGRVLTTLVGQDRCYHPSRECRHDDSVPWKRAEIQQIASTRQAGFSSTEREQRSRVEL